MFFFHTCGRPPRRYTRTLVKEGFARASSCWHASQTYTCRVSVCVCFHKWPLTQRGERQRCLSLRSTPCWNVRGKKTCTQGARQLTTSPANSCRNTGRQIFSLQLAKAQRAIERNEKAGWCVHARTPILRLISTMRKKHNTHLAASQKTECDPHTSHFSLPAPRLLAPSHCLFGIKSNLVN